MILTLKQQLQATDEHENSRIAPRPETFLLERVSFMRGRSYRSLSVASAASFFSKVW
jgi:hypothetical protein